MHLPAHRERPLLAAFLRLTEEAPGHLAGPLDLDVGTPWACPARAKRDPVGLPGDGTALPCSDPGVPGAVLSEL